MSAKDIMHPNDLKAIQVLQKIPCIDSLCRKIMEYGYERIFRGENLGTMVKASERCLARVYTLMKRAASRIGIDIPEVYVYNDPVMNAFTFGETNPYICVSSSLIEKMNREERKAILAHECGHILCQHVLYNSVVETLRMIGENFGIIGSTLTGSMKLALQYWSRRSELSADRCAAVVVGERTFQAAMLKLALGLENAGDDPYRLVRQAKEYHQHEKRDIWSMIQQNCRVAFFSHPQHVNRAYEIDRWKKSYDYRRLRNATANVII